MKKLLLFALIAALIIPFVGCSDDDDDDPPPPPPPFGPSLIAVGDDGVITMSGDALVWTQVTAPTGLDVLDLVKVVRVAPGRLVTFGNDSATSEDSEIWYSTNNGSTWLEATITEQTGVRTATYFVITDIAFANALEGIAVGTDGLVLFTLDGGENWTETLNTWSDTGLTVNPGDQEISWNTVTPGTSGNPVQGTTLTHDQNSGTPGTDYATMDVVCWDPQGEYCVVTNIQFFGAATALNSTDPYTWGADGTADAFAGIDETDIWRYEIDDANCVFGVETTGTGTDTTLTFWIANDEFDRYEGVWKLVSSAAVPGAARTWTWTTPTETIQTGTVVGDFSYDSVHRFFFFDEDTGVAARQTYGWMTTEDGGATWTYDATSDISAYDEYWSEFWYINNGATGWLYSLENDGYFARTGIDYLATATPPYQFSTTAVTEVLTDSGTNNDCYDGFRHTGAVNYSNRGFLLAGGSSLGYWSYGSRMGQATFDNDVYSYTAGAYLGGVAANGSNPIYLNPVEGTGATSVDVEHWCQR